MYSTTHKGLGNPFPKPRLITHCPVFLMSENLGSNCPLPLVVKIIIMHQPCLDWKNLETLWRNFLVQEIHSLKCLAVHICYGCWECRSDWYPEDSDSSIFVFFKKASNMTNLPLTRFHICIHYSFKWWDKAKATCRFRQLGILIIYFEWSPQISSILFLQISTLHTHRLSKS